MRNILLAVAVCLLPTICLAQPSRIERNVARSFDTLDDMLAWQGHRDGDLVTTRGRDSAGDGGGDSYIYHRTGLKLTASSIDTSDDTIFITGHRYHDDDRVIIRNGGGATAPGGLAFDTIYYAHTSGLNSVYVPDTEFKLSATRTGGVIDITDAGSGNFYFEKYYDDQIFFLHGPSPSGDDYFERADHVSITSLQAGCKPDYEYFNRGTDNAPLFEAAFEALAEASTEYYRVGSTQAGLVEFIVRGQYRVLSQVDQERGGFRWNAQDAQLIFNGNKEDHDAVLMIYSLPAWKHTLPNVSGGDLAYQLTSEHQERFAAICIKSADNCDVYLQTYAAVGVGLLLEADTISGLSGGIIAYNRFYGGFFSALRTGIELSVGSGGGFTNENSFYGTNFTFNGGEIYCTRTGIKFSDPYNKYSGQNANRFYSPCFQVGGRITKNPGTLVTDQYLEVGDSVGVNYRYFNPANWQEYYCNTSGTVTTLPTHTDKSTQTVDGISWRHVGPYYSSPVAHYAAGSGNNIYSARWEGGDGPFAMYIGRAQGVVGNNYDFVAFGGNTDRATPYLNFFDNPPATMTDGGFAATHHVSNHGSPAKSRTYQIDNLHLQTIGSADGLCIKGLNYLSRATSTWSAYSTNYNDTHMTLTRGSVHLAGGDSFAVLLPKSRALSYGMNKTVPMAGIGADKSHASVFGRIWGSIVDSDYKLAITSTADTHIAQGGSGSFSSGWYTPQADIAGLAFTMNYDNDDAQYVAFGTASGAEINGLTFSSRSHLRSDSLAPFLPVKQPETRFSHGTPTEGIFPTRGEYITNVKSSGPNGWIVSNPGALVPAWTTGTVYRTGQLATSNGDVYYAQRNISGLTTWAPGQSVSINDIRLSPKNGEAYICTSAGTTGSTDPGGGNGGYGSNLNDGGAIWRYLYEAGTSGVTAPTGGPGTEDFDDGGILWTYYSDVASLTPISNDPTVNVVDFGAVGDGTTDSTAAIQAAADAAELLVGGSWVSRPRVYIPAAADRYIITDQVIIPTGVELICDGTIEVQAAASATKADGWVRLGDLDASPLNLDRQLEFKVSVVRQTQSDWSSDDDVGVFFTGHAGAKLDIDVVGFGVGLYYSSAYGRNFLGEFRNCGKGVLLDDSDLFVNASNFWGGYFACNNNVNATKNRYGIYVRPSSIGSNSCSFFGQSYELDSTLSGGAESTAVYLDGTVKNIQNFNFLQQRTEAVNNNFQTEGTVFYCNWESALGTPLYQGTPAEDIDGSGRGNYTLSAMRVTPRTIFDTGPLVDSYYEVSATKEGWRNMVTLTNGGAAPNPPVINTQVANAGTVIGDAVSPAQFTGVFINTTRYKDFQINFDLDEDYATGNVYMIAYSDLAGSQTANSSTAIKTLSGVPSYNSGAFGGFFNLGSLGNGVTAFTVDDAVEMVFVSVHTGAYKRWSISCFDGFPAIIDKSEKPYHNAEPTDGTWLEGDFVRDSTGNTNGWICTTSGTDPAYTGVTCDTSSGSPNISNIANVSQVSQGDFITIAGVTGTFRILHLDGTDAILDGDADATLVGAAVSTSSPTWKAVNFYEPSYASIYNRSFGTTQFISFSGSSTDWSNAVQVSVFDTNGPASGATPDHTNDHVTVAVDGDYRIDFSVSFVENLTSAQTYYFTAAINNKASVVGIPAVEKANELDRRTAIGSSIVSLTAGDTVEVWVQNTVGTSAITALEANLSVEKVD